MRLRMAVVVMFLSLTLFSGVSGQATPSPGTPVASAECAGAAEYVAGFLALNDRLDNEFDAAGIDIDEFASLTPDQLGIVSETFAGAVTELLALMDPTAAVAVNADVVTVYGTLSQLFLSVQTGGIFAAVAYTDPIETATADVTASSLLFEETCNVAMVDHDEDGELEIGAGGTAVVETPMTISGTPVTEVPALIVANPTGTRENPITAGTAVQVSDEWLVTVISVQPDANAAVQAENSYNEPPAAGEQYFIAQVSLTYTGPDSDSFYAGDLAALGPSSVAYSAYEDGCGVTPGEVPSNEVFTGGTVTGNVCWSVTSGDLGSLAMYFEPSDRDARVFLSLNAPVSVQPDGGTPVATPVA